MKTKTFLMVCLFMGIGLTQLSAQNGQNGTGAFDYWSTSPFSVRVYSSNGEQIDQLSGWVTYHAVHYFEEGTIIWWKNYIYGILTSEGFVNKKKVLVGGTGEEFLIRFQGSGYISDGYNNISAHYNAIGNQGSHYIIFYDSQVDLTTFTSTVTFVKAVSPGTE